MAKYIVIERPNGMVTMVRSIIETASEDPLTEHEELINELFSEVKKLNIPAVVGQSEQLKAFADYAQKRMWEDGDKDLSEFVDEFLSL